MSQGLGTATLNFPESAQAAVYRSEVVLSSTNPNHIWVPISALTFITNYTPLCYGNGVYVAASASGTNFLKSSDLISWQYPTSIVNTFRRVVFGNSVFVSVAATAGTNVAITTVNGDSWTQRTLPAVASWTSVAFGNGVFVAVAAGPSAIAATSTNGISWTQRALPVSAAWSSIAFGNGVFVAVASGSAIAATSTDGINWTQTTLSSSEVWGNVVFVKGRFIAHLAATSNKLATSTDGITWTAGTFPKSAYWYDVVSDENIFLATNSNAEEFATSTDGVNWVLRKIQIPSYSIDDICYVNGKLLGTVSSTVVSYAPDTLISSTVITETSPARPSPGTNRASVTVTGLTTFTSTDAVEAWVQGTDSTADHTQLEHAFAPMKLRVTTPITGVGFTIQATSEHRLTGDFKVRYAFTS